jgi:hypothetical protein
LSWDSFESFAGLLLRRFCVLFFFLRLRLVIIAIININAFIFQCPLHHLLRSTCIVIIVSSCWLIVRHGAGRDVSIERNHWRESRRSQNQNEII